MNCRKLLCNLILPAFLLLLSNALQAQNKTITGRVTDAGGAGIVGVSVTAKGTNTGTSTGTDGSFSITVPSSATTLVFSSVGYTAREVAIGGQTSVNVSLQTAANSLNEVVVVGYGTQRRKDVTASISKISADKIGSVPAPSFESALAGKAAGVQVTTTSGLAGSGAVIRIRGINSISIAGDPLYVIDGIPIDATYVGTATRNNLGQDRNPLANINPNDIESVEILKDAGAAGIYGSRGANGVVLITTKRGKGKMRHNFSSRVGFSGPTVKPDFVDKNTWLAIRQEAWELDGNTGVQQNLPGRLGGYPVNEALAYEGTNWWDLATRTGITQDYNYSVTKGIGKFGFYLGGNYGKEQSYIVGNDFRRLGARFNVDYKPLKNLSLGLNTAFYSGLNQLLNNAWNGGLGMAMSTGLPYYPVYNADGSYFRTENYRLSWGNSPGAAFTVPNSNNLVAQRENSDFRTRDNRIVNSLTARYTPIKNLDISGTVAYEQNNSLFNSFYNPWILNRNVDTGAAENNFSKYKNYNYNLTANYNWELNENNRFTFLLGTEYQEQKTLNEYAKVDSAGLKPIYDGGDNAKVQTAIDGASPTTSYERLFRSVFARINYNLKGKYILQASIRRDESSVFRENNTSAWFPTVSGAWVISDEAFMQSNRLFNLLKLRASWGLVGTSNIDWKAGYSYFDTTTRNVSSYYNGQPTIFQTNIGNPDLKWETSSNVDVALEAGILKNRINFELGYYRKKSTDVLIEVDLAPSNGFNQKQWQNLGSILNQGLEFSLNTVNVRNANFSWTTNFNIAHNYNEVLDIGSLTPDALEGGSNETRIVPGYPVGTIFTVRYYGVDPADGLPIFLDINGKQTKTLVAPDGGIGDRVPVANTAPEYTGGLTNNFRFKNWELNTVFTYQIGGHIWDNSGKRSLGWITDWNIYSMYAGNYWRQPGDNAKYPRPTLVGYSQTNEPTDPFRHNSSIQVFKSDYFRLRELTLNYHLPKSLADRFNLSNAKVFLSGFNVLLFTKYPIGDPESGRDGENNGARNQAANANFLNPPLQRSVNFGINLSF